MTFNFNKVSHHKALASVSMICLLTAVSCTKKNDDTPAETKDEVVVVKTTEETVAPEVDAISCDDDIALKKLNQTLRDTLIGATDRQLSAYSNRMGAELSMNGVISLVDSILIDVASPTEIQPVNTAGMVTCKANLSMTLPNNDINRAKDVYKALGGTSLDQSLAARNITANNNMLVSKNFSYVVGMQGGQTTAKIVGEPALIMAVADIVAKSKIKTTLDASQPVVRNRSRVERPRVETPRVEQPTRVNPPPAPTPEPEPEPTTSQPEPTPTMEEPTLPELKPSTPDKDTKKFSVPEDDSIEMVIIEEEGTY